MKRNPEMSIMIFALFLFMIVASCFMVQSRAHAGGFSVDASGLTTATVTTTSALLVAADPQRNYLIIQNNGATNVIVKFGSIQSASEGIIIPPGGNYEPFKGFRNSVFAKSASATDSVTVQEGR